jgi:hypothetical protein
MMPVISCFTRGCSHSQVNVQRGEQNIEAQQYKDLSRKLYALAATVTELVAEVHGDEVAAAATRVGTM